KPAKIRRLLPWWTVGVSALAIVLVALIGFHESLSSRAAPILDALAARGLNMAQAAPTTPGPTGPTGLLKQLLAPPERSGQLMVEELGKRTVVTLQIPGLFVAGRAQVANGYAPLFATIGQALERVPGQIIVAGHTNDQPVGVCCYANNFDLSSARAHAVAQL